MGVNLDGWLVAGATPEHLATFAGDGDFALLASWRFTHVRLPVDAALLDSPRGWAALDAALAGCARHGLRGIVALRVAQGDLFVDEARWRRLVELWQALAVRYAGWGGVVGYDLLDKPDPPDDLPDAALRAIGAARLSFAAQQRAPVPGATASRAWTALATTLTHAIRAADPQGTIVVQAVRGAPEGFTHLRPTRDANTLYAVHCFAPEVFTWQQAGDNIDYPGEIDGERWDRTRLERWLQPALDFAGRYEAPLYLGAFGASALAPHASQLTWVRSAIGLCRAHDISWAYWTYRAYPAAPFGLLCDLPPAGSRPQFQNPQRLDYDLLGVLQSEA